MEKGKKGLAILFRDAIATRYKLCRASALKPLNGQWHIMVRAVLCAAAAEANANVSQYLVNTK